MCPPPPYEIFLFLRNFKKIKLKIETYIDKNPHIIQ